MFLRKFFKFNVCKPLDVKTKFLNVEENVLLEVQIQNITPNSMFLEVVNFEAASGFTATCYDTIEEKENSEEE